MLHTSLHKGLNFYASSDIYLALLLFCFMVISGVCGYIV